MKNRRLFISIFAVSLAVTLLVSPVKVFNNPVVETIQVQAEEEPITDTQRGVALLMTIMLAQGLRFVGDWNTVVQPGLVKLWNDFSTATGNAVTLPMIVAGSSLALGYIRTSNTVNNAIANFTAWYKQTFSQPTTGDVDVPVQSGGLNYIVPPLALTKVGSYNNTDSFWSLGVHNGDVRVVFFAGSTTATMVVVSTQRNDSVTYKYGNTSNSVVASTNVNVGGVYYGVGGLSYGTSTLGNNFLRSVNGLFPVIEDTYTQQNAVYYTFGAGAGLPDITMEGQSLELKDGYQLESDQAKLYDLAGITSLVAALSLTLENIDDLVRDIPLIYDTPWSLDYPDNPTYVDTPDDTIPWVDVPDSVIPADTPEYVPTIPSERDEYKVLGLDQVFPFSIPFDLYYLSQILVAEPVTPQYTFAVYNPITHNLISQQIDLSSFDTVASVFRASEVVLFIAFLIWITRFLIRS